jgi:flagellar biosynthesis anti-sigma factor FlgM
MNVKNDLQAVQQMLGSQQAAGAGGAKARGTAQTGMAGADEATLSSAASLAAKAASTSDVRMDKVSHVQQALAAGTYAVPSSEVAGKMIDQMLGK